MTEKVQELNVDSLHPSPWNRDGNGDDKEFLASIKANGILNPIIVRKRDKGGYEIVAGHRRHHAADLLKQKTVPCLVRDLSDEEAITVQITENLQRKNLGPVEEARAFDQLRKIAGGDYKSVAKTVDKSEKYVYRALAILQLPAAAIKALESGKLTAAHAHQLLRVGPKQMDTMVKYATTAGWKGELPTVHELEHEIDSKATKDLAHAPFPKDKEYAGKIACTKCPFNTGNQDVLFDGAESGHCTNGQCFNAKTDQHFKDLRAIAEKKYPGLPFIGQARASYLDVQQVKGWLQVDPKDKKVAKAMVEKPDQFGLGILSPGGYGNDIRKPTIVVLTKDRKIAGVKDEQMARQSSFKQATPEEQAKAQFIERLTDGAVAQSLMAADFSRDVKETLIIVVWRNTSWNRDAITVYFNAVDLIVDKDMDDEAIGAALGKLSAANLDKLLMWILIVTNENNDGNFIDAIAEANEIDLDKARKDGAIAAGKQWEQLGPGILAELAAKKEAVPA